MKEVYLLDGARTAFGSFGQAFRDVSATELGKVTAIEALKRANVEPSQINQVVYGNVIHSSTSAAYVPRHIALQAGVPIETPVLGVNRLCGSGLQAVVSAAQSILLGEAEFALAGGTENMSQAPHSDFKSRFGGVKLGDLKLVDMLQSALTDEYAGCGMGVTAENLAKKYEISREEQDEYAKLSHERAEAAREKFAEEIVPVEVKTRKGSITVDRDEHIKPDTTMETLAKLRPAFLKDGSVTAGNASGINDGAASVVLASGEQIGDRKPLAKIVSWGIAGVDPTIMGIGPAPASRMALERAGLTLSDIDFVEVNEAFAAQYIAVEKELGLDRSKTNVNGGAIALGHPVGASGARVLLTVAYELRRQGKRYGLASLCIGGGQGIAMIIENVNL
ncbi:acetyl-CoA C-acyltransferase [Pueribacillus theae]|uniref:acetyl-CoA C-acetyltransferase n=1 Tax=Pueribacillus theae TaxID=2171751 RepID=A0A2U1K7D9_9BACI|nr:acetyl-CoA C-acetyltransferase [Pueribacillus theae]PWA13175.1 acetyl-CoA C-acyltransferase [Pueribacillus theae]